MELCCGINRRHDVWWRTSRKMKKSISRGSLLSVGPYTNSSQKKVSSSSSCSVSSDRAAGTFSLFSSSCPASDSTPPLLLVILVLHRPASLSVSAGPAAPCDLLLPHLVLDLFPNTLILFSMRRPTWFFSPLLLHLWLSLSLSLFSLQVSPFGRSLSAGCHPLQRLCLTFEIESASTQQKQNDENDQHIKNKGSQIHKKYQANLLWITNGRPLFHLFAPSTINRSPMYIQDLFCPFRETSWNRRSWKRNENNARNRAR